MRARGTPRVANRLLKRVRDFAQVHGTGEITGPVAIEALEMLEVDEAGLDRLDRALLRSIVEKFVGGPVGLSTLAVSSDWTCRRLSPGALAFSNGGEPSDV